MRPRDLARASRIERKLSAYNQKVRALPGITNSTAKSVFVEQLFESIHRVEYVAAIRRRPISDSVADPNSDAFDPIKAAILFARRGNIDEAFWLVFLSVHFGKHNRTGWRYVRDIYGSLGGKQHWTWARVSANPGAFINWLANAEGRMRNDGILRRFGNHRKYQSISARSSAGTGEAVRTYCAWVLKHGNHQGLIQNAIVTFGKDQRALFDGLFRTMTVTSFGRMAKFDFLTMVGKVGIAAIRPGSLYLQNATGPVPGGRLLFGGRLKAKLNINDLDRWSIELGDYIGVGAQEMEDALCNWQKSPTRFVRFRG
jgi:hypothetical protein